MFCIFNDGNDYITNRNNGPDDYQTYDNITRICREQAGFVNNSFFDAFYSMFPDKNTSVLDIGCGAGWIIHYLVQNGYKMSLGIDGFYAFKKYMCEPWVNSMNHLLNTDIAKPFIIEFDEHCQYSKDTPFEFDVINSSEFMEHVFPEEINQVCQNISNHLKKNGTFICNLSHRPDKGHESIFDEIWWIKKFEEFGIIHDKKVGEHFHNRYSRMPPDSYFFCFKKQ